MPGRIMRIVELTDPARLADFAVLQKRKGEAGTRSLGAASVSGGKRVVSVVATKARHVECSRIDPRGTRPECLHLTLMLANVMSTRQCTHRAFPLPDQRQACLAALAGHGPGSDARRIASTRPR
jgi:hypothetical protein